MIEYYLQMHAYHPAVDIYNQESRSPFLFICEHASHHVPTTFANLGLTEQQILSHIGWDIGAYQLARELSEFSQSTLISAKYSRLLIDCNRSLTESGLIPEISESTAIPGNQTLTEQQRFDRIELFYKPFHQTISETISQQQALGIAPIIVTIHSFTPVFLEQKRDVEIGVLFIRNNVFAKSCYQYLKRISKYEVQENAPYDANLHGGHMIKTHGINNNLHNVAFEVRHDLLSDHNIESIAQQLSESLAFAIQSTTQE